MKDITKSIVVSVPVAKAWDALINPKIIKQYLFGTNAVSDWKIGSDIIFKGEWEGKSYEDKGTIMDMIPEKLLQYTHWSPLSGPEKDNTYLVTFELESVGENETKVTVTQGNNKDETAAEKSGKNWEMVLDGMKKVLEK